MVTMAAVRDIHSLLKKVDWQQTQVVCLLRLSFAKNRFHEETEWETLQLLLGLIHRPGI